VLRPHTNETSVIGAAMSAAVGARLLPDFPAAVAAMSRVERTFTPNPKNEAIYRALYRRVYLGMYERLLPLHEAIGDITGYPGPAGC
jgi:ribulose kinase